MATAPTTVPNLTATGKSDAAAAAETYASSGGINLSFYPKPAAAAAISPTVIYGGFALVLAVLAYLISRK